jgi:Flp pilus assembly protein TadD
MTMTARSNARVAMIAAVVILFAGASFACVPPQAKLAAEREKDPQYQYEKAVVCMQAGLPDEAIKYLNKAVTLDPRHYLSYNLFGLAYMVKRDFPDAAAALEKCIALKPDFSEPLNNLGTVYDEMGQKDRAEAAYKKAFEIDRNYNASYNLAKLAFESGRNEPALEYVGHSLQKYPRSILAWNLQGLILDTLGRTDEAISSYQQALKIAPNEENVSYNLAVAYYRNGGTTRAREILEKILPGAKTDDLRQRIRELLDKIK